jgi:hypothetical protein
MANKLWRLTRELPVAQLVAAGQIVLLARRHWHRLEPDERRRLVSLVRQTHGRTRNLSARERAELGRLVHKADPRLFVGIVAQRFSPVPLPRWVLFGRRN